ncbi:mandelate racemase/muconate lactonizing enzyme family protein [Clostridium sp. AM58-1XD]|uniref:mandelate racemase/muconate lactonizing enzyme family protein n=1 Tax=Clostridium sp. AM58-1XD TaxID=2292307 RepID=UPI001A9A3C6C|nr:mandelate racemase/muconate lactonizing enzyme family protein [Clostridium sp. AM58-1XD]
MSIITNVRTIRIKEVPNIIWVELETDEGLTGLGEVWRGAEAVEAVIHSEIAPWLLGQDSCRIEYISRVLLTPYVGFHSAGAETRAASAIDIALWDLAGKRQNIPVYEALGGSSRLAVQVYNTCSGYSYNKKGGCFNNYSNRREIKNDDQMTGPYDDQVAFNQDAGKLAESLMSEGYKAMKIWPFDPYAAKSDGKFISDEDLRKGLEPFRKIREAVGNKIEVMCELHSMWSLPAAVRICRGLEEYDVFWAEDAMCKMDDTQALHTLRSKTKTPICGSETLAGSVIFRQLLSAGAFDYTMIDLGWCGGLTEGRKISYIAESFNIPIAPHDCTGPVLLWAGLHLAFHCSNTLFQEVVRANLATWYRDMVDELPIIRMDWRLFL